MISFFDHCVDTRAKRQSLVQIVAILVVMYMIFTYVRLATHLFSLENYDDLFALLQIPYIKQTYIFRAVLSCMVLSNITILEVVEIIWSSLRFFDVLTIFCFINLAFLTDHKKRRIFRIALLIWGISVIISGVFAIFGLQANSLQMALMQLRYIGIAFMLGCIGVLHILLYMLVYEVVRYREALRYVAIELT